MRYTEEWDFKTMYIYTGMATCTSCVFEMLNSMFWGFFFSPWSGLNTMQGKWIKLSLPWPKLEYTEIRVLVWWSTDSGAQRVYSFLIFEIYWNCENVKTVLINTLILYIFIFYFSRYRHLIHLLTQKFRKWSYN